MVIMPVWIIEETDTELICFLGSEPGPSAKQERIPKLAIMNISKVEITMNFEICNREHLIGRQFAVVCLDRLRLGEPLIKAMYTGYPTP